MDSCPPAYTGVGDVFFGSATILRGRGSMAMAQEAFMTRCAWFALVLGSAGFVGGCGGSAPQPSSQASTPMISVSSKSCQRLRPGTGAVRATLDRQGGAVVLANAGQRHLAYVADADSRSIHTIDVDAAKEIATTSLPGAPS